MADTFMNGAAEKETTKMNSTTYAIDDGDGNEITAGLQGHNARQVAQRLANERGEPVYLYKAGDRHAAGDDAMESEEFTPEVQKGDARDALAQP